MLTKLLPVLLLIVPATAVAQSLPATIRSSADNAATLYRQAFAFLATLDEADSGRLGLCGTEGCWVVTTPLDAGTAALLSRQAEAVALIRRAAAMPEARWDLNGDANKMVEIANQLPRLAALMVLQARHGLRDGQPTLGVDDLMVATTVSRHAATTQPTIMTKMVETAAFRPAAEALAGQLPTLPKELVAALPGRFARLPKSSTMQMVVRGEFEFARATAPRQGAAAVLMVATLTGYYDALAEGGDLPPDEFARLVDAQSARFSANPWAGIIAPQFKRSRELVAALQTRQAMLMTAIEVVLHGEAAVAASTDPCCNKPFAYKKTPRGFELTSALVYRDRPVALRVGGE
jgi:hypothetical protein